MGGNGASLFHIFHKSHHADDGGGVDGNSAAFVIQADIAAYYRRVQRPTGLGHAFNGFSQGPILFRHFGAWEVQAVGNGSRFGAGASHIAGGLRHCSLCPLPGVQGTVCAVAVNGSGNALFAAGKPQHPGAGPRTLDSIAAGQVIKLAPEGSPAGDIGAGQEI